MSPQTTQISKTVHPMFPPRGLHLSNASLCPAHHHRWLLDPRIIASNALLSFEAKFSMEVVPLLCLGRRVYSTSGYYRCQQ